MLLFFDGVARNTVFVRVVRQLKVDALRFVYWMLRMRWDVSSCWSRAESDEFEIVYVLEGPQGSREAVGVSEAVRRRVDERGWSVESFRAVNGRPPIRETYINT